MASFERNYKNDYGCCFDSCSVTFYIYIDGSIRIRTFNGRNSEKSAGCQKWSAGTEEIDWREVVNKYRLKLGNQDVDLSPDAVDDLKDDIAYYRQSDKEENENESKNSCEQ